MKRILVILAFLAVAFCAVAQEIYPMYNPCRCETGKWGYVDQNDNWAVRPIYDAVLYETNGGMYPVSKNGKWGFVGISGEPLTDIVFDAVVCEIDYQKNGYTFNYAAVRRRGKWAFIDVQGNFVTAFAFDEVLIINGKYIIRNREGKQMRNGYLKEGGVAVWND